jgi:hypothetical protein
MAMRTFISASLFAAFLTIGGVPSARAQETIVPCTSLSNPELNKLEKVYTAGDIRVFYTEQAPKTGADHRLPAISQIDANGNGVPDFVENVAKQADVSRKIYAALGFRDPLEAAKYHGVKYIDINLLNMSANGLAYGNSIYYPAAPKRGSDCTLRMDISANLELAGTFTTNWFVVGHEMFHLFQYGQTLFKRTWVNEPTAKWAEYSMRLGEFYPLGTPAYTLPASLSDFQITIVEAPTSTVANRFWSRLIDLVDGQDNALRVPDYLLAERYTDGNIIIKDRTLRGAAFIANIYQTLGAEDAIVSHNNGWNPYDWPQSDQTSDTLDLRILPTMQRVIRRTGISNPELDAFLAIQ